MGSINMASPKCYKNDKNDDDADTKMLPFWGSTNFDKRLCRNVAKKGKKYKHTNAM